MKTNEFLARFRALAVLPVALAPLAASPADGPVSATLASKGVSIYYTVEGQGEPVLLIHGLYASGQLNWRAPGITKLLAQNYQVITMDVRGHGRSGKPEKVEEYGLELVEDVVRLLDHLKLKQVHVIGYSMGGMITMKLLTLHPERVRSAALGGMGWVREGSSEQVFWGRVPERQGAPGPATCARSLGALAVTRQEVAAIRVPVAVLVADRDPVRRMYVTPLEAVRSDWPVTIIEGAGHMDCVFQRGFREGLKKWLGQQAGKSR